MFMLKDTKKLVFTFKISSQNYSILLNRKIRIYPPVINPNVIRIVFITKKMLVKYNE